MPRRGLAVFGGEEEDEEEWGGRSWMLDRFPGKQEFTSVTLIEVKVTLFTTMVTPGVITNWEGGGVVVVGH